MSSSTRPFIDLPNYADTSNTPCPLPEDPAHLPTAELQAHAWQTMLRAKQEGLRLSEEFHLTRDPSTARRLSEATLLYTDALREFLSLRRPSRRSIALGAMDSAYQATARLALEYRCTGRPETAEQWASSATTYLEMREYHDLTHQNPEAWDDHRGDLLEHSY